MSAPHQQPNGSGFAQGQPAATPYQYSSYQQFVYPQGVYAQQAQAQQAQQAQQQFAQQQVYRARYQAAQQQVAQQQAQAEQARVQQERQQVQLQAQSTCFEQAADQQQQQQPQQQQQQSQQQQQQPQQQQQQAQARDLQDKQAEADAVQKAAGQNKPVHNKSARASEKKPAKGEGVYPVERTDAPVITLQNPPKRHGWIVALVFILCAFALGAFGLYSCSGNQGFLGIGGPVLGSNTVAIINMDGAIQYDGSTCSPEGLESLLQYAEKTDAIKAVVLRVNSSGGTATAGEEMAAFVSNFSKPVVVSSAAMNASAAYEISSQADYIYVAQTTEIGSIGTFMQVTDYSGLMNMLGIKVDTIASASSKDAASGYRALTQSERDYYQRMVDQINEVFIQNVAAGRGMSIEAVRQLATGMLYTGIDAVENGLADSFGGREDALMKAAELAGLETYSVYELGVSSSISGFDLLDYLLPREKVNGRALEKLVELYGMPAAAQLSPAA